MEDESGIKDHSQSPHSLFPGDIPHFTSSEESIDPPAGFTDEWLLAGADSAEQYQQILLDSARFNHTWPGSNLGNTAHNMTPTRETGGDIELNDAATIANIDVHPPVNFPPGQTFPIRSKVTRIDPSSPTVRNMPEDFTQNSDTEGSEDNGPVTTPTRSPPQLIQHESFEEIQLRLTNEFAPIVEHDWDTLIWIGPPAQEHDQDDDEYDYIKRHFSKPYLMSSATLRKTGSSELAKLLGPKSARAQRSLKKLDLHRGLPGGREPKYYIDLRPPQDGDAAVEMVTEMSCTPGVLSWHKQATRLGVDKSVVCGTDSLNIVGKRSIDSATEAISKEPDEESAYSALRYHLAIERLLQTIAGESPRLNSAPKLWTFVAIARHLDCAQHPNVISEVYSWLFADRNSSFIQYNPEVTYRIARCLKLTDLTRVSYALLVGEKALWQRCFQTATFVNRELKLRPLCQLDEDEVNRIDHAARSFGSRIQSTFLKFMNEPMSWMVGSTEVLKLLALKAIEPADQVRLNFAWTFLRGYVRRAILQSLTENLSSERFFNAIQTRDSLIAGRRYLTNFDTTSYNKLSVTQRLFTRAFWEYLKTRSFEQDTFLDAKWKEAHSLDGIEELAPEFAIETFVPLADREQELIDAFEDVNAMIDDRDVYYPAMANSATGRIWPSVLLSHLYASAHENLLHSAEEVIEESGKTIKGIVTSKDELTKTLQWLNLKRLSSGPPDEEPIIGNRVEPKLMVGTLPGVSEGYAMNRIVIYSLLSELRAELAWRIQKEVLTPGWADDELGVENEVPIGDVESLISVGDGEWKYLPLWAGGLDDGTGGVFAAENVPDMEGEEGFRGGRLGLDDTLDGLGDVEMGEDGYSMVDSEFEDVATDDGVSTVGKASRVVTVGTRSTANTVMSLDE